MSSQPLAANLQVIETRWPAIYQALTTVNTAHLTVETDNNTLIINDVQLTSNYDRIAEATLQISRIPTSSETAFIYGPGLGDTCELLLQRPNLKQLHVIILNLAAFLHVLNVIDNSTWLSDTKIQLHLADNIKNVHFPFLANPAELVLADDNHAQLRDQLELELNNQYIQEKFSSKDFQTNIIQNLDYVKIDSDIQEYHPGELNEVFIAAAGPTLESHLTWLKENPRFIICVDAAFKTLINAGITPNLLISIDKRIFQFFTYLDFDQFKAIPLVYFPSVDRYILERWQGKRFCTYSQTPMFADIKELEQLTPLFSSGSVIHPAIDLAIKLGAKRLFLLGADFSYPNNRTHAGPSDLSSKFTVNTVNHWLFNYLGEKQPTQANFKGYLRDLEKYIKRHPEIKFYSGSEQSAKIEGVELWKK